MAKRLFARSSSRPLHPPLTDFPVALLVTALLFDLLSLWVGNTMVWAAFYNNAAGVVFGLLAALTGTLDYNKIPDRHPAKRLGIVHGLVNATAITLFAVNVWVRSQALGASSTPLSAVVLGAIAVAFLGVGAAIGSHMVLEQGVGVDTTRMATERKRVEPLRPREPVRP